MHRIIFQAKALSDDILSSFLTWALLPAWTGHFLNWGYQVTLKKNSYARETWYTITTQKSVITQQLQWNDLSHCNLLQGTQPSAYAERKRRLKHRNAAHHC